MLRNNCNGNAILEDAFQVHCQLAGWGLQNEFSFNQVYLDQNAAFVLNVQNTVFAVTRGNSRFPAGNMYKGEVRILGGHT